MKKDRVRDYATEAFRDYALALKSSGDISEARRMDIAAVEKMLTYFADKKPCVVSAVKAVYFTDAGVPFRKKTVTHRVRDYALTAGADESTVYRWLRVARCKFAEYRGLVIY